MMFLKNVTFARPDVNVALIIRHQTSIATDGIASRLNFYGAVSSRNELLFVVRQASASIYRANQDIRQKMNERCDRRS
ncbi:MULTISPECIES: hypothetical protein [Bradyrhizobium]